MFVIRSKLNRARTRLRVKTKSQRMLFEYVVCYSILGVVWLEFLFGNSFDESFDELFYISRFHLFLLFYFCSLSFSSARTCIHVCVRGCVYVCVCARRRRNDAVLLHADLTPTVRGACSTCLRNFF